MNITINSSEPRSRYLYGEDGACLEGCGGCVVCDYLIAVSVEHIS